MLILSTELTELIGLCDRVLVMVDGSIAAEFGNDELTEEMVMPPQQEWRRDARRSWTQAVCGRFGRGALVQLSRPSVRRLWKWSWPSRRCATFSSVGTPRSDRHQDVLDR